MFRLLNVTHSSKLTGDDLTVELAGKVSQHHTGTFFSVMLGKNGTGKSRLMRDLVNLFVGMKNQKDIKTDLNLKARKIVFGDLREVQYQMRRNLNSIKISRDGEFLCAKNDKLCDLEDLDLPKNIIAYTSSIHDKFPLPRNSRSFNFESKTSDFYQYLGHRERSGRSSSTASIYKVIDRLISAEEFSQKRLSALNRVFRFLKYHPILHIEYQARQDMRRVQKTLNDSPSDLNIGDYPSSTFRNLQAIIYEKNIDQKRVLRAIENFNQTQKSGSSRSIATELDLNSGFKSHLDYDDISLLIKCRLLSIRSVKCETMQGNYVDIRESSSGEIALFSAILGIGSVLENSSLVLLDEPEISLHPDWQKKYLTLLQICLREFEGQHIVVATHSPLIVSSSGETNTEIISLDNERYAKNDDEYTNSSIDYILLDAFGSFDLNNSYLKKVLEQSLRTISIREFEKEDLPRQLDELKKVQSLLVSSSRNDESFSNQDQKKIEKIRTLTKQLIAEYELEIKN